MRQAVWFQVFSVTILNVVLEVGGRQRRLRVFHLADVWATDGATVSCGQQRLICSQVCYLHTPVSPVSPLSPNLTLLLYDRLSVAQC